jgi:prophage maintenance system killer protein
MATSGRPSWRSVFFLAINGYKADQIDAIQTMLAVAAGELDERGLTAWIAKNSAPARSPKKPRGSR